MDQVYDTVMSPEFQRVMQNMSIVCILLAIGVLIAAFVYYGRARETEGVSPAQQRWVMLFATLRDSMIIICLWTSEALVYRFSDLAGFSNMAAAGTAAWGPIIAMLASYAIEVLIFVVAILRIVALSRWISALEPNEI